MLPRCPEEGSSPFSSLALQCLTRVAEFHGGWPRVSCGATSVRECAPASGAPRSVSPAARYLSLVVLPCSFPPVKCSYDSVRSGSVGGPKRGWSSCGRHSLRPLRSAEREPSPVTTTARRRARTRTYGYSHSCSDTAVRLLPQTRVPVHGVPGTAPSPRGPLPRVPAPPRCGWTGGNLPSGRSCDGEGNGVWPCMLHLRASPCNRMTLFHCGDRPRARPKTCPQAERKLCSGCGGDLSSPSPV